MLKELREKRAALGARIAELRKLSDDASRAWTAEDEANWKQVNAEYDDLGARIERAERAERIAKDLATPPAEGVTPEQIRGAAGSSHQPEASRRNRQQATDADRAEALQGWMRAQVGMRPTQRQIEAAHRTRSRLSAPEFSIPLLSTRDYAAFRRAELRLDANVNLTAASGGYTVPTGFVANLERALLAFSPLRQIADVIRTATGNPLHWPTANDTGNKGEMLAEETTYGDSVAPAFSEKIFNAYKMSSKPVKVSAEILEDSAFDMAGTIASMLGERLGRIEADYFTTGTGSSQPGGVVTEGTLGKTTSGATAITYDEIIDLIHSVDPAYRNNPACAFVAHDGIWQYLRKVKDGDGIYVWQQGLGNGQPDRLLGYRCITNQSMAATLTATYKTIVFGDLSKFKIRDVGQVRLRRLVERYADTDQEAFVAFSRVDAGIIDAATHPVRYLQQHA